MDDLPSVDSRPGRQRARRWTGEQPYSTRWLVGVTGEEWRGAGRREGELVAGVPEVVVVACNGEQWRGGASLLLPRPSPLEQRQEWVNREGRPRRRASLRRANPPRSHSAAKWRRGVASGQEVAKGRDLEWVSGRGEVAQGGGRAPGRSRVGVRASARRSATQSGHAWLQWSETLTAVGHREREGVRTFRRSAGH